VCFLSLYLNRGYYQDSQTLIRYGVTFIVISGSFPTALFLFALPESNKGVTLRKFKYSRNLPWLYFAAMGLMVIWQYIDFAGAQSIGQFFIASEARPNGNISGFFRVSTDLAPVLAILFVAIGSYLYVSARSAARAAWLSLAILLLMAGSLIGSRVFFLALVSGLIIFTLSAKVPLKLKITGLVSEVSPRNKQVSNFKIIWNIHGTW